MFPPLSSVFVVYRNSECSSLSWERQQRLVKGIFMGLCVLVTCTVFECFPMSSVELGWSWSLLLGVVSQMLSL